MHEAATKPILLFDGDCGLCNCSVRFILRHEHQHDLLFASQQGTAGRNLAEQHHVTQTGAGSAVLIQEGVTYYRSDAALGVMRLMGGIWKPLAAAGALVPRPLRDSAYDLIARNRGKLSCSVKHRTETVAHKDRFLDMQTENQDSKATG